MNPRSFLRHLSFAGCNQNLLRFSACGAAFLLVIVWIAYAADVVPTDIKLPGTQPVGVDNPPTLNSVGNCGCHGNVTGNPNPEDEPIFGWEGAMMGNAGRDPLFWATLAIAEQDFLPGSGGVGDLCLKCHSTKGWIEGRSTPTTGSGLAPGTDDEGIMCHFCHQMVNPDQLNNIPSPPEGAYIEEQNAPFLAYDETTGEGYYGGAEYVLNSGGTRLGPFDAAPFAKHNVLQSEFFRDGRFCGTCHDVSNPAVGDLAHNHGSIADFTGTYNGTPNGIQEEKVALNNPPHTYGIVERTFSEWLASGLDDQPVNDFMALPPGLQVPGGSLERAYRDSLRGFCSVTTSDPCNVDANCSSGETCVTTTADFEDGTTRYFTCQTCHMAASGGKGAKQGPLRTDLPRHDQTGGSYWIQNAIQYMDTNGTLLFGGGLSGSQITAMNAAMVRAGNHLRSAGSLSVAQVGFDLKVTVTNLTGHKLITGYPEGRRMWLNLKWKDSGENLIYENGAYGPIGNVIQDLGGTPHDVESILDFSSAKIYEAEPAMTQEWANQLLALGYPPSMVLEWDRSTNLPKHTLGDLGAEPPGTDYHTFHFVLNNFIHRDNRIPPFRFDYDLALARNALPIPSDQYGNPGPGGIFDHWDDVYFPIPAGTASVEVRLYYQSTSWEYIQFLWLQNEGTDPFLGSEGVNMLDAWLNTGMSAPFEMALWTQSVTGPDNNAPGIASGPPEPQMIVAGFDPGTGGITIDYSSACDATGHTIHYGGMADIRTYGWSAADCTFGLSGTGIFFPDPGVGDSIFWVIVGNNPDFEGSYGTGSVGVERPPNTVSAGVCFRQQNLAPFCGGGP